MAKLKGTKPAQQGDFIASIEWEFREDSPLFHLPTKKPNYSNVVVYDQEEGEPTEEEVLIHFFGKYLETSGLTIDDLDLQIEYKFRVAAKEYQPAAHLVA